MCRSCSEGSRVCNVKRDLGTMLQHFLTERLKMVMHTAPKNERPAYNLEVSKGGVRMRKVADDSMSGSAIGEPLESSAPAKHTLGKDGFPVLKLEPGAKSGIAMGENGRVTEWMGTITMAQFASRLASRFGRAVIDKTDLKGKYDITLRFVFARMGSPGESADTESADDPAVAIQSQLGLRLKPTKVIRQVVIIDHIEKVPTKN